MEQIIDKFSTTHEIGLNELIALAIAIIIRFIEKRKIKKQKNHVSTEA